MTANSNVQDDYITYRPLLFSIAYRMLGSVMDAEDVVQETFIAWNEMERKLIQDDKSYLCKMTTNRCLDLLRSARKRRETYIGPWLPEPLIDTYQDLSDPLAETIRHEQVSTAFLLILEQLTPVERAVFVLRELYEFDYGDIAEMVDKNPANCRKIYSRAKQKIAHSQSEANKQRAEISSAPSVPAQSESLNSTNTKKAYNDHQQIIHRFLTALEGGDTDTLLQLLQTDAQLLSDGGGNVQAATRPLVGRTRILAFLQGIWKKAPDSLRVESKRMNGDVGLIFYMGDTVWNVVTFSFANEQLRAIYIVSNPDKLRHISRTSTDNILRFQSDPR